jgi:proline iminopeptidase
MSDGAESFTWTSRRTQVRDTAAVILLHGGPGLWDYLGPVGVVLDEVAVVHRYDQRGCGRSSPSDDLSMTRYITDIEELRVHWSHERLVLIGHSFGATLALAYAGSHPNHVASVGYMSGVGIGDWRTSFRAEVARRRAVFGLEDRLAELGRTSAHRCGGDRVASTRVGH